MGYPTKVQLISRKKAADQHYINNAKTGRGATPSQPTRSVCAKKVLLQTFGQTKLNLRPFY